MPRVYTRKFDWTEAQTLRKQGLSWSKIGDRLGVSANAVRFACLPDKYEKAKARAREWVQQGVCPDCGAQVTRNNLSQVRRCRKCWAAERATSVRPTELHCVVCKAWKPDDDFPRSRAEPHRRGRHTSCRPCQTIRRRDYRNKNKVPCANGCGRLVLSPNEQAASAKQKGYAATGMCRSCAQRTKNQRAGG